MKIYRWTNNLFLSILYNHILFYPTPKNLNYFWSFGALSGLCLILQILTGLFLSMHYVPEINFAFLSIEHITRDVNYGWLLRYLHSNGASMFFIVIFFHIFRNLYFGSFLKPRIYLWFSGIIIFFLIMATAFMGYVLPWGQMSFWGATVITNLFSAIPIYGLTIVEWLWGGFSVDQATLNRFYSLHFFLPFIISAIVFLHLGLLHEVGSSDSVSLDSNKNFIHPAPVTFFPYFFVKDLLAFFVSLLIFFIFVFFIPNTLGHPDNYINANSMVTPAHIVPEWYFLPFYAILRSVPNKLGGVIAMLFAILGWFFLPLFTPKYKSPKFKLFFSIILWFFLGNFIILGWIGQQPVELPFSTIGMFSTIIYFLILFFFLPCLFMLDLSTLNLNKNELKFYILKTSSYGLTFPLEYLPFEVEIFFYISLAISLYLNVSWATNVYIQRASGDIPVTIDQHYQKILEELLEYNRNLLPGELPREMPLYIDITQLPLEQWPIEHLIFFVVWCIGMGMAIGYFILVVLDDFEIVKLHDFYPSENTKSTPSKPSKEILDLEKIDLSRPQDVDLHSITSLSKSLNNIDLEVEDSKINFFSSTYQIIIDIYNYFFN